MEAITGALNAFTWIFSIFISLMFLQVNLVSLGIFTGLVGAGVSIAFRDLLNNFFLGILLNLDNSIKLDDLIRTSDGIVGEVKKISLRYTSLRTKDNVDILIPNSVLVQNRFENFTRTEQEVRLSLRFSVGQEANIERIRTLVLKACLYVPEVSAVTGRNPALFYLGPLRAPINLTCVFGSWIRDPGCLSCSLMSHTQFFGELRNSEVPLPSFRLFAALGTQPG